MIFRINLNDLILNASDMELYIQNFDLYKASSSTDEPHFLQLSSSDITHLVVGSESYKKVLINLKRLIEHFGHENVNLVNCNQLPEATWVQILKYLKIIPRNNTPQVDHSSSAIGSLYLRGPATNLPTDGNGLPLLSADEIQAELRDNTPLTPKSSTTTNSIFAYKKAHTDASGTEVGKLKNICKFLNEQANALCRGEDPEQIARNLTDKASALEAQINQLQQPVSDSMPVRKKKKEAETAAGHSSTSTSHSFG